MCVDDIQVVSMSDDVSRTVEDSQRQQKKKMIFYIFGLVRDRKRLKFARDRSLNHQNLSSRSPAKQDLCSDSREKFGQPQKNR
jgi:5-methylcytosine-specific restriction endonuclease McrBC GTP-binding regulatory subunit McrB